MPIAWRRNLVAFGVFTLVIAGAVYGTWNGLRRIREAQQRATYAEARRLSDSLTHSAQRYAWAHERDSLRVEAAAIEIRIVERLRRIHDTVWLPADTTAAPALLSSLRTCHANATGLATECDAYRATTTRALEIADSTHAADSAAQVQLAVIATAARDTSGRATARAERAERRPGWSKVGFGSTLAAIIAYIAGRLDR